MTATITAGDIGSVLRYTIKDQDGIVVDVSAASEKSIILLSPTGKKYTKTATLTTTGTDGQIEYTIQAGDLDAPGTWLRQAKVVVPAGTFFTGVTSFDVVANIR